MSVVRVISLQRHARRREQFRRRNAHLNFTFFDAVDGSRLTADEVRASGAFTREVEATYQAHAYGAALSHWHLWKEAAAAGAPLTIAEDDAVFRHDFAERSREVLAGLPADWDLVLWGWNFDTLLHVHPMGNVSSVAMLFDQPQLRQAVDEFQPQRTPVQAWRLRMAFGLPAYTLSPRGAAQMLALCFPLRPFTLQVPVFNHRMGNIGVDCATNVAYPQTQSFACFPPLAVTPNVRGDAAGN
ncbi:glycosyltransferase family 25 protein [Ramlibacter humi]|uniref:Glycosyl transferase n=1 Tax=Ramlibacter humi TaxID=2530451 RepID=A0A4Z0CCJ4_9BURK|nr:glycosyltransferase family 25 protein [Ramlibacter humi]TFZ08188.1 glycosyl transferase [Ramlibacter humi]